MFQPENQYAPRCLLRYTRAYISKDNASDDLAPAIKKIMENSPQSLMRNPAVNQLKSSISHAAFSSMNSLLT